MQRGRGRGMVIQAAPSMRGNAGFAGDGDTRETRVKQGKWEDRGDI